MTNTDDCIFCKIITGEIPATKVYEDEYSYAFLDAHPNTKGHTLVIPKDHFENIYGIPDETLCRLMISVKKISLAVKNGLEADGINIAMNNEAPAGQIIFHAHVHVIPRYVKENSIEKDEIVEKIQKEL